MTEITRNSRFVSASGGKVDVIDLESGECLAEVSVPPGIQPTGPYLDLVPVGAQLQVGPKSGLSLLFPRSLTGVSTSPRRYESGANPDFQPTSASRMERELRVTLSRLQNTEKRLEARERSLSSVSRGPKPKQPDPVIEDNTPTPAPAPEPEPKAEAAPKAEPKAAEADAE